MMPCDNSVGKTSDCPKTQGLRDMDLKQEDPVTLIALEVNVSNAMFAKWAPLSKANASKADLIKKIVAHASYGSHMNRLQITELLDLGKDVRFAKGTFWFSLGDDEGFEYPFFAMLSQDNDVLQVEEFSEMETVMLDKGYYYLKALWQKAESGGRQINVYKLDNGRLEPVFEHYYRDT